MTRATRRTSKQPKGEARREPLFNQSVQKAFAVLAAFSGENRVLSLEAIAKSSDMTTSSAQRCVYTLVQLGFVRRNRKLRGWTLTPRTLEIGYPYLAGHPLLELATTHLVDLNQRCGESVSLSEPEGEDMVFIARFYGQKRFFIHMPVGSRLPMYCTAAGRAYLSALPREEARSILKRSTLRRFTPHTLVDIPQILKIVDAARDSGYAWACEECYRGDLTIGAPILDGSGLPLGAVNISGPTSRWNAADLRKILGPQIIETARSASGSGAKLRVA